MSPRRIEWQVRPERVQADTGKFLQLVPGWSTPRWAEVRFVDPATKRPVVTARAELRGKKGDYRAIVTAVTLGDGKSQVRATDLRALLPVMHELAAEVLSVWTFQGQTPDGGSGMPYAAWVRAMSAANAAPNQSAIDRQDAVLNRWETEFMPQGLTQAESAPLMDMKPSTFRTYLTHARKRRGY